MVETSSESGKRPELDPRRRRARWGGGVLAVGAFVYAVAVLLYVGLYGGPEGTGPGGAVTAADTAAYMRLRWTLVRGIWLAELLGALLVGIAGFLLLGRRHGGRSRVAAEGGWVMAGVGGTVLTVMYAFVLGSYPPALEAHAQVPAVFEALRGGARFLFLAGTGILLLGLATAFHAEASAAERVLPRWLSVTGAIVSLIGAVQAVAYLAGVEAMAAAAPVALLAFLLTGVLGLAIWSAGWRATLEDG